MRKVLVLGGPGAGKTRRLLEKVDAALESGVAPSRIAFVSFTKAAVGEAVKRATDAFGLTPDDLPNFRTVHSLAFRELGLRREEVLSDEHLDAVIELTGEKLGTLESPFSEAPAGGKQSDPLLTLDHYARTTGRSLADSWADHGSEIDWHRLLRFSRAYASYKEDAGVVDFTDMLTRYAEGPFAPLDVEVAIVDEAQDLSRAQWRVVDRAFARADVLYVGGDDMQMIHHWAGADEDRFLSLRDSGWELENLPLSHRLPRSVFAVADAVGERIFRRYRRSWRPSSRDGLVGWASKADEVDLSAGKDWLLLARTRSQLPALAAAARDQGVVYSVKGKSSVDWPDVVAIKAHETLRAGRTIWRDDAEALGKAAGREFAPFDGERDAAALGYDASMIWHDALTSIPLETREYYLTVLRRGGKLTDPPRVAVETIHGAKGREAEGVVLSLDMTRRTHRALELDPDSENRVFYVGLTRASERMILLEPRTPHGYQL